MPISFVIRSATETDIPAILEIYNEEILHGTATFDTEAKTLEERRSWFARLHPRYPILIAKVDDVVRGWAAAGPWSERKAYDVTVENSVYVSKDFREKGLGKALLEELLSEARAKGFHSILARITDGNQTSIQLHRNFGFQEVGTMKEVGKKFGRLLDVTLMQRIL